MFWCGVADSCYCPVPLTLPILVFQILLVLSISSQCHVTWAPVDYTGATVLCLCAWGSPAPPPPINIPLLMPLWDVPGATCASWPCGGISALWGKPSTTGRQELMDKIFPFLLLAQAKFRCCLHDFSGRTGTDFIVSCINIWGSMNVKKYILNECHHLQLVEVSSSLTAILPSLVVLSLCPSPSPRLLLPVIFRGLYSLTMFEAYEPSASNSTF